MLCIYGLREGTRGTGSPSHISDAHLGTGMFEQLYWVSGGGQRGFIHTLDLCFVTDLYKGAHFRVSLKCLES